MSEDIKELNNELQSIGQKISLLNNRISTTKCPSQQGKLRQELKQLQWQALFYLEKIENIKNLKVTIRNSKALR